MLGDKAAKADTRRRQAPLIETSRSLQTKQSRTGERKKEREGGRDRKKKRSRRRNSSGSSLFVHTTEKRSRPFVYRQVV